MDRNRTGDTRSKGSIFYCPLQFGLTAVTSGRLRRKNMADVNKAVFLVGREQDFLNKCIHGVWQPKDEDVRNCGRPLYSGSAATSLQCDGDISAFVLLVLFNLETPVPFVLVSSSAPSSHTAQKRVNTHLCVSTPAY